MNIYCTYLTVYHGNKLPPFYIGSTSVERINNGYLGSVSSKRYKDIWEQETKDHPEFFDVEILSYHKTDREAREKELFFHKDLGVVKSPLYTNLSEARVNGFFGKDVSGKNNPRYGHKWGDDHPRGMKDKKHSEESKKLMSVKQKGKKAWNKGIPSPEHSVFMSNKMKGNQHLKGFKHPKVSCIKCHKTIAANTLNKHILQYCHP
jgi:hypothetical protein